MRNTNKKGFTIVELVIVVAVIAILAAVLIPTFSGIIKKAQLSADQKAERDMNTALAIEMNPDNLDAAIDALIENGFNGNNLIPVSAGYSYVWSKVDYKIYLVKTEEITADHVNLADGIKYIDITANTEDDLANAIANGSENIKLNADVVINSAIVVPVGSNIVLDLNGKTISAPATGRPFELTNGASLTINAGDSIINCGQYGLVNILSGASASVTLNGGNYIATTANGAFIKVRQGGEDKVVNVTLNNVNYIDNSTDGYISNASGFKGTFNLTVNGGSYKAALGITAGNVDVKNATIETKGYAVYAYVNGSVENCTITTEGKNEKALTGDSNASVPGTCVTVSSNGTLDVKNSTLDGEGHAYYVCSSGGTITATKNNVSDTLTVWGGTADTNKYHSAVVKVIIDGVEQ